MKNIIQLVVFTLALSISAFAQFEPIEPVPTRAISFVGDQSVAGTFVETSQKVEGNSFVLDGFTKEYKSTLLTIAFDYNGMPDYNGGNEVAGGSWNLAVYSKGGDYKGSLYGTVTGGTITWSVFQGRGKNAIGGSSRNTKAQLKVLGGTGEFFNVVSTEAHFQGDTDLQTNATVATVEGLEF